MANPTTRTRVFVSYSHRDRKWLERLKVHIKPLVRDGAIVLWEDGQVSAGADWRSVIATELSSARVAILLISADFLASDFIAHEELPGLLRAAEQDGAIILPLIVSPSRFTDSVLSRFKSINAPSEPLIAMKKPQREDTFVRLAAAVHRAASLGTPDDSSETDVTDTAGAAHALPGEESPRTASSMDLMMRSSPQRSGHHEGLDVGATVSPQRQRTLLYDSDNERVPFSSWIRWASRGSGASHFPPYREGAEGTNRSVTMRATGNEAVGLSKSIPVLSGVVTFAYQVVEPRSHGWHVYFAMIPMQQSQQGLLEVGGAVPVDPRNARSPYRIRVFVPGRQYGDGRWHPGRMAFDFDGLPSASYSIFGARINEGGDEPGPATLLMRSVRAWTH